MTASNHTYDIAIIGTGIAGTALGAILARHGLRVVLFEAKSHPRFAIGESMILETSETLRAMAELYDVPELAYFSSENYFACIGTSHGVKRHFSYLHHVPGQPQQIAHALQAVIPRQPHGHELHLYRQDSDFLMLTTAIAYGATVLQNTPVQEIDVQSDRVEVITAAGATYTAAYVVDAGGFRSILAERFGLRDFDLRTHSRTIFTHMVDVPDYHAVGASQQEYGLPFSVAEGTLHHIFAGGWLWVIPFNNHDKATNPLCSVGLLLDPRIHPERSDLSPEEEFYAFVAQYPSMAAQFRTAKSVRPWTRTGRIQYSSTRVVGDRFCLLGHAAGFIDPLFSKGLYSSFMAVSVLANLLLDAAQDGDYSAARFQPLEETTRAFVQSNDRLISNAYKSFADPRLWQAYSVLWLLGAYTELVKLSSVRVQAIDRHDYHRRAHGLKLVGGGFGEFDRVAAEIDALMDEVDPGDPAAVEATVAAINAVFARVDWVPQPFVEVLNGKNHLPANKLRVGLLNDDSGFLGHGAYREHFFGDGSMTDLVLSFVREKMKYSSYSVRLRQRRQLAQNLKFGI